MNRETVYLGRDNTIDLALTEEGVIQDLGSVTKMAIEVGAITVSSDSPGTFDWITDAKKVSLKLGGQNLPEGVHNAPLVVFAPAYPNGLVWGMVPLKVVKG